jgi:hypothetical protein
MGSKRPCPERTNVKNRNGEEYEFGKDNNKDTPIVCPEEARFPDIPAEDPGILTKHKKIVEGVNAIQDKPMQSDEERALLAEKNSGLEFGPIDIPGWWEVIKLLDDNEKEALNYFIQDNVAIKIKKLRYDDTRKMLRKKMRTQWLINPWTDSEDLVLYFFSVFWDTFVYYYTGIMPNFNDVYLDNYQVLDYGLICKK